jgi:uncharacterized protein (TIGR03790 family)
LKKQLHNLKILSLLPWFITGALGIPGAGFALEPKEIFVIANRNAPKSIELARYYMQRRGVPQERLMQLRLSDSETCERKDYEKRVLSSVRGYLRQNDPERRIRCILTMYGLPLKVAPPKITGDESREAKNLENKQEKLLAELRETTEPQGEQARAVKEELEKVRRRIAQLRKSDQGASLDSEIALVLRESYPLASWVPNPFFARYSGREIKEKRDDVFMVSRLDGPSSEIVKRIIDQSVKVEKEGLKGAAYFDARWLRPKDDEKVETAYKFYDKSIHKAAELVRKSGRMPVVLNDKEELFQPRDCPDAALYCGWYSLGKYVDALKWQAGSVGYHIASAECETLKKPGSTVWCKRMLEEGVAATVGPVNEPYVQALPIPEMFFRFLLDGHRTLAEVYALSQPFWSWQMVLIGDPLYRPFKR